MGVTPWWWLNREFTLTQKMGVNLSKTNHVFMDEKKIIQIIADEVERTRIDIAPTVETFTQLVYGVASIFNDAPAEGADIIQRLCEPYPHYCKGEVAQWYAYARRQNRGNVGVGTIIKLARDAAARQGVTITLPTSGGRESENKSHQPHEYQPAYNYIEPTIIMALTRGKHVFRDYLETIFDKEEVKRVLASYYVGGDSRGRTVFPNIDENGRCVGGKVIQYLPNGHRNKAMGATTIHYCLGREQGDQVLFGSHLLKKYPDATVAVVEAEKTAIVMTILMPPEKHNVIWVATSGKGGYNDRLLKPLYNRNVVIFPDTDAAELWGERTKELPFSNATINRWYEGEIPDSKKDIADKVLTSIDGKGIRAAESVINQLFPNNNAVSKLVKLFDLEIVDDDEPPTIGWKLKTTRPKGETWVQMLRRREHKYLG